MIELKPGQLAKEFTATGDDLLSVYCLLERPVKGRFKAVCIFESEATPCGEVYNLPGEVTTFMISMFIPGDSYWEIDNVKITNSFQGTGR
jgi:hypothetical protein